MFDKVQNMSVLLYIEIICRSVEWRFSKIRDISISNKMIKWSGKRKITGNNNVFMQIIF